MTTFDLGIIVPNFPLLVLDINIIYRRPKLLTHPCKKNIEPERLIFSKAAPYFSVGAPPIGQNLLVCLRMGGSMSMSLTICYYDLLYYKIIILNIFRI